MDRISDRGKALLLFPAFPAITDLSRGKIGLWLTGHLFSKDIGDLFKMDPKNEPEKGFILIGLGLAIILIILITVWYYRKKNREEEVDKGPKKGPKPERRDKEGKKEKVSTKKIPVRPPSKDLERLRDRLENGSSYSRKKALRALEKIIDEEPGSIVFLKEGLKECLSDPDRGVRKGSARMIKAGAGSHPDVFIELIGPLMDILEGDDEGVSGSAVKALLALGKNSDGACSKIILCSDDRLSEIMERDEERSERYLSLLMMNGFLRELGTRRPDRIGAIMKVMSRNISYPVYRPEIEEEGGEQLFISAALSMGELLELSPSGARTGLPKVIKVLADTYSYDKCKEDADDGRGMRRTFEDLFDRITAGEPGVTVPILLQNLSATSETVRKIARDRISELSREEPGPIILVLMECLGSSDEAVKKNAMSVLAAAAQVDPTLSVNIMIGCLRDGNKRVTAGGARVLRDILDRMDGPVIDDVGPLRELLNAEDREVRQEVVGLLGKIVEKDPQKANECIGHIVKALKQEWGVRLVALASLEQLSMSDENLRNYSVPHIMERLHDEHDQVRWRASNVLKKLGIEEKDVKNFESAKRQMDLILPKLKELKEGTSLDLGEIRTELGNAKKMMKLTDYAKADEHATRTKEMLLELQCKYKPELDVTISSSTVFPAGEHNPFSLTVLNKGMVHIYELKLAFSENVEIIREPAGFLKAGSFAEMKLAWTPERTGRMPIKVSGSYRDKSGVEGEFGKDLWVDVGAEGDWDGGGSGGEWGDGGGDGVTGVAWD